MIIDCKFKIIITTVILLFSSSLSFAKKAPDSFANLAEILSPSVVNISTTTIIEDRKNNLPTFPPGSPFEEFFKQFQEPNQGKRRAQSLGSGFIIDKKGYIITNNHVIDNAEKIKVILHDDQSFEAEVVGKDPKTGKTKWHIKARNAAIITNFFCNAGARFAGRPVCGCSRLLSLMDFPVMKWFLPQFPHNRLFIFPPAFTGTKPVPRKAC